MQAGNISDAYVQIVPNKTVGLYRLHVSEGERYLLIPEDRWIRWLSRLKKLFIRKAWQENLLSNHWTQNAFLLIYVGLFLVPITLIAGTDFSHEFSNETRLSIAILGFLAAAVLAVLAATSLITTVLFHAFDYLDHPEQRERRLAWFGFILLLFSTLLGHLT